MKLLIKKELLLKGINIVEKNIGRNLTLPILNNILLKTNRNFLNFISTDLETALYVEVSAKIETQGSIVISPKVISGFLNNIPDDNISITLKDKVLSLEQKNFKVSLKGEEDKDYPLLPKLNKNKYFTVNSNTLIEGLNQTINTVSLSDLKPELTGILFSIDKDEIKLASTDSFRLSEKKVSLKNTHNIDFEKVILPHKTIQEIIRNYQNTNEDLFIFIEKNQIIIENKENNNIHIRIISKTIEGEYPEYSQIIPKEFLTKATTSKKEFLQQIKAASPFSSRINDVKLKILDKKIEINSQNYDIGEFKSFLNASIKGEIKETKELVFNYQYLLDGLNNIKGDEVSFKFFKTDGPVVFESTEFKDYFYILMPIRN